MAEDTGGKEEKFDFTAEGEAFGYISLDQARVLAMGTARDAPGDYGAAFRNASMAFSVTGAEETEDYYEITLSIRPQGEFSGTPGQEQFFIEKEGTVAHRQVLTQPRSKRGFPVIPAAIGLAVVAATVIAAAVVIIPGDGGGEGEPAAAADDSPATSIPAAVDSTATHLPPTAVPGPSPTVAAEAVPPAEPVSKLGVTGRYVNADDSSEFLEINADGTFSWTLPGKGIDRSGVWTGDGSEIALDAREALQTKRIVGRELLDPGGGSWEKYGGQADAPGTYLRLNFEQLGDYLELLPDGSFIAEEGGLTSEGTWQREGDELVLTLVSEAVVETTVEDGAIIDSHGVRWVKQ